MKFKEYLEENRTTKEMTKFYNSVKPGDRVKYVGPEKNVFKKGETYEVDYVKSDSKFQKTVLLKSGNKKIKVTGHSSIEPI